MKRLICYLFGHKMHTVYSLDNYKQNEGHRVSAWGLNKCSRCSQEDHWQYDNI